MRKVLLLCNAGLVVPTMAFAAGVDLTWNECVGVGTEAGGKTFTCTGTVNETYQLVVQFKSPVSLPAAAAVTALIDLETLPVPLSPFWHYEFGRMPNANRRDSGRHHIRRHQAPAWLRSDQRRPVGRGR